MIRILAVLLTLIPGAAVSFAQIASARTVQASGNATIYAPPDQAQLDVGVVTNGSTAQEAAQLNATMTTAVLAAIKSVLGSSGTVQTVSYYIAPRYSNVSTQSGAIVGYTASNTVRVTTVDLSIIGKLIDAANQAGANTVGNLNFGLQDPEPKLQQALAQATKQAMAHAGAIAAGLGATLGQVITAQQGSAYTPIVAPSAIAGAVASTPVQTGTVSVYASVSVTAQLQ